MKRHQRKHRTFLFACFSVIAFLLCLVLPLHTSANAAETLEIGEVKVLGNQVKVPVILHEVGDLKSLRFQVELDKQIDGRTFERFEFTSRWKDMPFHTSDSRTSGSVYVDVISEVSQVHPIPERLTIGYLYFRLDSTMQVGDRAELSLRNVRAEGGRFGRTISLNEVDGMVERNRTVGDVFDYDEPNAATAMRIIQHVQGDRITDREKLAAADIDGDGLLTQADAQEILHFVTGNRTSFLAVTTPELPEAILDVEYAEVLQAVNGREPYTWSVHSGRLPRGLVLDDNGTLTGALTSTATSEVTFEVQDSVGNTAEKTLSFHAVESDIAKVEQLDPISIEVGDPVSLPSAVQVTYKEGRKATVVVDWEEFDRSVVGTHDVQGEVGDTGRFVTVKVTVHEEGAVSDEAIQDVKVRYLGMFDIHTIQVQVSDDVFGINISAELPNSRGRLVPTDIPMHFEGDNEFSLATNRLSSGEMIEFVIFDRLGREAERIPYLID